jgi:ribosomal protein S18 acetylase RimI-like enzyme
MDNYICKVATLDDVALTFDYYIERDTKEKYNWIKWKEQALDNIKNNRTINYHGVLNGKIICEATAAISKEQIQNSEDLVDDKTAYLFAFRTLPEYRGQGYFSILFKYMINDLMKKGYERVTIGVEPQEIKNKKIYQHYGFVDHIKDAKEYNPDGTSVDVEYYSKNLK